MIIDLNKIKRRESIWQWPQWLVDAIAAEAQRDKEFTRWSNEIIGQRFDGHDVLRNENIRGWSDLLKVPFEITESRPAGKIVTLTSLATSGHQIRKAIKIVGMPRRLTAFVEMENAVYVEVRCSEVRAHRHVNLLKTLFHLCN